MERPSMPTHNVKLNVDFTPLDSAQFMADHPGLREQYESSHRVFTEAQPVDQTSYRCTKPSAWSSETGRPAPNSWPSQEKHHPPLSTWFSEGEYRTPSFTRSRYDPRDYPISHEFSRQGSSYDSLPPFSQLERRPNAGHQFSSTLQGDWNPPVVKREADETSLFNNALRPTMSRSQSQTGYSDDGWADESYR